MLPDDKTEKASNHTLQLLCPTCGARYTLPKYIEGQKYGCKRCSASLMFGKFALLQELGRGGFGVVYKAFQADLERVVALKFLHTDSQESTERFMREARIAANLSHPNITAIYEVGQHEGKPYITMQFVDGITTNRADFSVRDAVFVMRDAAIAVDYAHARDVIHRDIKPHNIMVMQDRSSTSAQDTTRRTFVMDFGLARSASKGGTLTTEGQVMGTPAFMAPEQAEGKPCDLRSDVYSLGATLYQLVTKRPPFEAPTPLQVLMAVTQDDPPAPSSINPEIDKGLEAIILKAMAKDAGQRYPTAARFAQDLTSWLAGGVTDAGPTVHVSMTPGALKAAARKKKSGAMVALGMVLILAGAGGLAWKVLGGRPETATAAKNDLPPKEDRGRQDSPPIAVAPAIVLLDVKTDPSDAVLTISTKQWRTPISLNDSMISPGTHDLTITKPGFKEIKERVTVTAGAQPVKIDKKLQPEDRKPAFRLESQPPGAKIMLNGTGTGAVTPHTIYVDEVGGVAARIELDLEGYDRETRSFPPTGETKRVVLTPKTGTFVVMGALPSSTIHLFALPPGAKNIRALAGLWSENPDQVEQAVAAMEPTDAAFVVEQLRTIAARPNPRTREKASKLAASSPSATPMKPEKTVTADGRGAARLENAWIMNRYCILATSPRTLDFLAADLVPVIRNEISVPAEMVVLTTVSARSVRPALGQFKVVQTDQTSAQTIVPGGGAAKVAVGPVTLQYLPPPNDPILRPFTLPITAKEQPYELAGNLYQYCAEAYLKDPVSPNIPMALRAYTKFLEERLVATSELPDRARTADSVRVLYRGWVDSYDKQGRTLGGDLSARIEEARRKPTGDAIPALLEVYTAKDATPAIRGAAAGALAFAHAKSGAPYESMEWSERSVKEKVDPGQESIGAVITAVKGYPGLEERWREVSTAIEEIRKAALAKSDPVPPPSSNSKIGILQLVSKTVGIIVKLEPDVMAQLAKGDVLEVFREDKPVGEIVVERLMAPEGTYPNGSAKCERQQGSIQKNDEVRKKK